MKPSCCADASENMLLECKTWWYFCIFFLVFFICYFWFWFVQHFPLLKFVQKQFILTMFNWLTSVKGKIQNKKFDPSCAVLVCYISDWLRGSYLVIGKSMWTLITVTKHKKIYISFGYTRSLNLKFIIYISVLFSMPIYLLYFAIKCYHHCVFFVMVSKLHVVGHLIKCIWYRSQKRIKKTRYAIGTNFHSK